MHPAGPKRGASPAAEAGRLRRGRVRYPIEFMQPITAPTFEHDLKLTAPIDRWDEAIPLGNGLTGLLLWGDKESIKLSLDRGDIWDNRQPSAYTQPDFNLETLMKLVRAGDHKKVCEKFWQVKGPTPSKMPTGRLELRLDGDDVPQVFHLDLRRAVGTVTFTTRKIEAFCCATCPVSCVRISGEGATEPKFDLVAPLPQSVLDKRGYRSPEQGDEGGLRWLLMSGPGDFRYAVVVAMTKARRATEMAMAVVTTDDDDDCVAIGRRRVEEALELGFDRLRAEHEDWWSRFWSASAIQIPQPDIERHYYLVQYFYGAASRRGAPPIPLQGVWTKDEGTMPPWKGDYHHDLNTQLTYWAYLAAGHFDAGLSFLDFMWDLLPRHRDFARDFYGTKGAVVVGQMALDGGLVPGYPEVMFSPTLGAWVAQAFYLHWRYRKDRAFLGNRAYPYCEAVAHGLEGLLEPDEGGTLKLPFSSSPEVFESTIQTWMAPNSNFDLALLMWLFGALAEMAEELGRADDASHWRRLGDQLDAFAVDDKDFLGRPVETGALLIGEGAPLPASHRHFSHLLPIHPLGQITVDGSDRDRRIIEHSLTQITWWGYQAWVGYSFSWMSCIAARCRRPEQALLMLDLYLRAFVSRNGFHLNGDFKDTGIVLAKYRPFTLEGNFAAAQAVHEMLLQSWNDTVRVFPAVPDQWRDASFDDLRAEGAFRVAARRRAGRTLGVRITATVDRTLRLRDPFDGARAAWNREGVDLDGRDYICELGAGQSLEGHLEDAAL